MMMDSDSNHNTHNDNNYNSIMASKYGNHPPPPPPPPPPPVAALPSTTNHYNNNNNNNSNNSNNSNNMRSSSHNYDAQHHRNNNNNNNNNNSGGGTVTHDMAKIFVGGLSWQTTEETLRYHFEQYGEVVSVEVMKDRNTGDPRGFAFVVFQEDATVELVMSNMPHEINHKTVDVKRAQARGMAPPSIHHGNNNNNSNNNDSDSTQHTRNNNNNNNNNSNNSNNAASHVMPGGTAELTPEQLQNKIFVGGLPLHLDRDGLKEFFSQFGPVVDAIVMMDPNQRRSRGFGFVTFENGSGGAQIAMKKQPLYMDGGKYVEIKLATPKSEQQQTLSNLATKHKDYQNHRTTNNNNNNNNTTNNKSSTGQFAGLAESYGRNGWKAGYGSKAFTSFGWAVQGWNDLKNSNIPTPKQTGFSFDMLLSKNNNNKKKKDKDNHHNHKSSSSSSKRNYHDSHHSSSSSSSRRKEHYSSSSRDSNKRSRY